MRTRHVILTAVLAASFGLPTAVSAVEDAGGAVPSFQEGDVLSFEEAEKLKPFLPTEFWDNRDFFFYEGMQLEDRTRPRRTTRRPRRLPGGDRQRYAGQCAHRPRRAASRTTHRRPPFPIEEIDCKGDPQAGKKIMWNFACGAGGGPAGRREVLLLLLGPRRAAAALLPGHSAGKGVQLSAPASRSSTSRRPRATSSAARSGRRGRPPGGGALRRARHHAALVPLQDLGRCRGTRRRTTTPGSTCRPCDACAVSRRPSEPTRCPAPTSPWTICFSFNGIVPQYDLVVPGRAAA